MLIAGPLSAAAAAAATPAAPASERSRDMEPGRTGHARDAERGHWECPPQPPSHHGRWQDLPPSELHDCPFTLSYLDPSGFHYYVPAIMHAFLFYLTTFEPEDCLQHFDSIALCLCAGASSDDRESGRARLSRFTQAQRAVMPAFMAVIDATESQRSCWERAVAHDESGDPTDWFDAFWPDRERPAASDVLAALTAAFPDDPSEPRTALLEEPELPLVWAYLEPRDFRRWLPAYATLAVRGPEGPIRREARSVLEAALCARNNPAYTPRARVALQFLNQEQRRALALVGDASIEDTERRERWLRMADITQDEWHEQFTGH